jgi:hypothetical protein
MAVWLDRGYLGGRGRQSMARKGQNRKDTLIEPFGGEVLMPDVRHLIAQCPRKDAPGAACGVYYAELRE